MLLPRLAKADKVMTTLAKVSPGRHESRVCPFSPCLLWCRLTFSRKRQSCLRRSPYCPGLPGIPSWAASRCTWTAHKPLPQRCTPTPWASRYSFLHAWLPSFVPLFAFPLLGLFVCSLACSCIHVLIQPFSMCLTPGYVQS